MSFVKIKPNDARVKILLVFLRINVVFFVLKFIFELYRYSLWSKILNGQFITQRSVVIVEVIEVLSSFLLILWFVTCIILFICWLYRSYENYTKYQFQPPNHYVYWTALSWFVPLLNLIRPYRILSELIESYEAILIQHEYIRYNPSRHVIKSWWWITLVLAFGSLFFVFSVGLVGHFLLVLSHAFFILSGILVVKMVSDLQMLEKGFADLKDVSVTYKNDESLLDNSF